jgi:hypothetical protein
MAFIKEFEQEHGAEVCDQMAAQLGISQEKAAALVPMLAPMILGGLQKQAQEQGGEERVEHIIIKYGDEGALGNIGELFSKKINEGNADPGLGGLLGDAGHQAANGLSQKLGISQSKAAAILPMLAPLVLGWLSRQRNKQGGGVAGAPAAGGGAGGGGMGMVMGILDEDGDGSILDDVAGKLFTNFMGGGGQPSPMQRSSGGGGLLSRILGGIFKK